MKNGNAKSSYGRFSVSRRSIVIASLSAPYEPVLPNLELIANDSKKRKIDTTKKDGRKKKSGKHERNRERVVSEHESATRKDGKNGEGAVILNSV